MAAAAAAGSSGAEGEPLAAYVHLPFCKRKCRYCDFPVIAVGMAPPADRTADAMADYVDLLCREIRATRRLNHRGPLKTVFFGGGEGPCACWACPIAACACEGPYLIAI